MSTVKYGLLLLHPLFFESDLAGVGGGYRCGTANEGNGQLGWDRLSRTRGKTEADETADL